jgi:hypothetical protein
MAFNIPPSKKTKRVVAASGGLRPYAHPAFPDKPLSARASDSPNVVWSATVSDQTGCQVGQSFRKI